MFKKYDSIEDYNADTLAPDEKRVSLIMDRDYVVDVKYDAPMREVTLPAVGDALFIDANGGKHFYRNANYTPIGMTLVGFVFKVNGNKVKIMNKTESNEQWLSCWQYAITAISSTSIQIGLRMSNNYDAYTYVDVTLTSAAINQTSADEISAAVAAKATEVGDTRAWWAWYNSANNRIVVQTDSCSNKQQSLVVGTGCTIALCVYDDMPTSALLLRRTMATSDFGIVNVSRCTTYYGNNGATPTSDVDIKATRIVKRASFESNDYCAALRAEYITYENYITANQIKYTPKYGVFTLPAGTEMAQRYGNVTAPTKSGNTKFKFPAIHTCSTVSYNADGLRTGAWHLSDIADGLEYLNDEVLPVVAASQNKMGTTQISSAIARWFSQRRGNENAWYLSSNAVLLSQDYSVNGSIAARAVCELTLSFPSNNQNS